MAVAFDAKTAAWTSNSGVATLPVTNLTVGTGANRAFGVVLICGSSGTGFPAGLTLTWDVIGANQSLTQVSNTLASNVNSGSTSALYGVVAPASGNKTLTISWTGNHEMHACAVAFTGVDQTSVAVAFPHGNAVSHTTLTAGPTSVTITSASGNMVFAGHGQNGAVFNSTNNTELARDSTGPNQAVAANYASGAASVAMTADFGAGTSFWDAIGCDVLAAASSTFTYFPLVQPDMTTLLYKAQMVGY